MTTHLYRYIALTFLRTFAAMLGALLAVVYLFDVIELLRRAAKRELAGFGTVLQMGLFKLPEVGQQLFPFAILFTGLFVFWRLTRTRELIVARASGVSVWQFLAPILLATLLIGAIRVGAINPLGAVLLQRYEVMEDRYIKGQRPTMDLVRGQIWLRQDDQDDPNQHIIIHAPDVDVTSWTFTTPTFYVFDHTNSFRQRIDVDQAVLRDGLWELGNGWINDPTFTPTPVTHAILPTSLERNDILSGYVSWRTLSFWELGAYIETLEQAGFPSTQLRLYRLSLLSEPFLYMGLILLAASAGLKPPRSGQTLLLLGFGLAAGFLVFLAGDVVETFGIADKLPLPVAAWAVPVLTIAAGVTALLHLEDG